MQFVVLTVVEVQLDLRPGHKSAQRLRVAPALFYKAWAMLSPSIAWTLSSFFAISYVTSVYIFPAGRLVFTAQQVEVGPQAERARQANERWRNDPATIRARLSGVALSTIGSCLAVFSVVTLMGSWAVSEGYPRHIYSNEIKFKWGDPEAIRETSYLLGFTIPSQHKAWLIVPLLYIGPLYVQILEGAMPFQKNSSMLETFRFIFGTWTGFRNIIGVRLVYCPHPLALTIAFRHLSQKSSSSALV